MSNTKRPQTEGLAAVGSSDMVTLPLDFHTPSGMRVRANCADTANKHTAGRIWLHEEGRKQAETFLLTPWQLKDRLAKKYGKHLAV